MSIQLIQQYYSNVDKLIRYGGTRNEMSLRKAFQELLDHYARSKNLVLVPEVGVLGKRGRTVHPDGTLKDALRQDWGYWESKDEKDTLEDEIRTKFAKGYPDFNILFEDTHTAVLIQGGNEIQRAEFSDANALDALLTRFVNYQPQEVREFHKAILLFSAEVGGLARVLRDVIEEQVTLNPSFQAALGEFLELAKKAINPKIEMADVREMIIQHVLTEDIFMRVFDEAEFHRENVIAHKLAEVVGTFYHGETKRNIHARIAPYYETINARASQIQDHHEKQKFLKALYESFYKAYNPKAADRLGIVYTPDEIVRFMIESAEPYPLERVESEKPQLEGQKPLTRLMARKEAGLIEVDTQTTLRGVPAEAWEYRLGTYSALEWILERYKEKKPKDPTIAERFNTYRFAEYKEQVIDLLTRVCTVSVETMRIVKEMP